MILLRPLKGVGAVIDLLLELSFGDNVRPSQVTPEVRARLVQPEIVKRRYLAMAPIIACGIADLFLLGYTESYGFTVGWSHILAAEVAAALALICAIVAFYGRRMRFLHEAAVTTGAVLDSETHSYVGPSLLGSSRPREMRADENDQQWNDIIHLVTIRLRFAPGVTNEDGPEHLLREDVPHLDVTKRLRGGWGTFASGLKAGSLVSLLYSPANPKRCRIVNLSRHHQEDDRSPLLVK